MKRGWIIGGSVVAAAIAGGVFLLQPMIGAQGTQPGVVMMAPADDATGAAAATTIEIRSAADVMEQVSASGKIVAAESRDVVLQVAGTVESIAVEIGDEVAAGAPLLTLDSRERAVEKARLAMAVDANALAQLQEPANQADLMSAQSEVANAEKNLAAAQEPAGEAELTAARAAVTSAWAKYNDLLAPATTSERNRLEAALRTAEVTMQEAQRDYDRVKWANDAGASQEGAALQKATISYEQALADYNVGTAAASTADLQSALSAAKNAERDLAALTDQPDADEIAAAEAALLAAQAKLTNQIAGATALAVEAAELKLQQSLVELEQAVWNLAQAEVTAPVAGTVTAIAAKEGNALSDGAVVVTLADFSTLEMAAKIAEVDVDTVAVGNLAAITLDAIPGRTLSGEVIRVAPTSDGEQGVVNYQIDLRVVDGDLTGVRADMTSVARLQTAQQVTGWLVPTSAISQNGAGAEITVVRSEGPLTVTVTTGSVQGEWTVVDSPQLKAGDQVVGQLYQPVEAGTSQSGFMPPRANGN
jgi:HlyD family secretion protein